MSRRSQSPVAGRDPRCADPDPVVGPLGRRRGRRWPSTSLIVALVAASLAVGCGGTGGGDDGRSGTIGEDRDPTGTVAETSISPTTTDVGATRNGDAGRPFRWTRIDRSTGLRIDVRQRSRDAKLAHRGTLAVTVTRRTPDRVRRDLGAAPSIAIGCQRRSGGNDLVRQPVTPGGPVAVGTTYTSAEVSVRRGKTFREDLDFCELFVGGPTGTVNEPYLTVEYEPFGADADR